jgi:hypothetical protein
MRVDEYSVGMSDPDDNDRATLSAIFALGANYTNNGRETGRTHLLKLQRTQFLISALAYLSHWPFPISSHFSSRQLTSTYTNTFYNNQPHCPGIQ